MAATEDVCLICAEPLSFVSVYQCGHSDVCALCTLRLRLVVGDKRCCACREESENVLVTRQQGCFTSKFPSSFPSASRALSTGGQFQLIPLDQARDVYFDDEEYRNEINLKTSLACQVCNEEFKNLKALKSHLKEKHKLFMCAVCLEGRRVFVQEQVLYTRQELDRHYKRGDTKGPMAEAGFKGHPTCQFCNKSFYSDQELYSHMQTKHVFCFLCRRERPGDYVYYKNLKELTGHFASNHHFCTHEECEGKHPEERVFATKEQFHVHYVQTHGGDLSKKEKKQALQIHVKYPSLRQQDRGPAGDVGGFGESSSSGGGMMGRSNASSSQQEAVVPDVDIFAHIDSSQQHWRRAAGGSHGSTGYQSGPSQGGVHRGNLNTSDYPALPGMSNHGSTGYQSGPSQGGVHRGNLNTSDYPALPGMSKSAKKRAKAKARAAEAVAHHNQGQEAWGQQPSSSSSGASNSSRVTSASSVSEAGREKNRMLMQKLRKELDSIVFNAFRQESASFLKGQMSSEQYYKRLKGLGLVSYAEDLAQLCPSQELRSELLELIRGDKDAIAAKPNIDQRDDSQRFVNLASILRQSSSSRNTTSRNTNASSSSQAPDMSSFPTLSSSVGGGGGGGGAGGSQSRSQAPSGQDKVANANLMMKLKRELNPETFAAFRMESMHFLKGNNTPDEYYHLIVSLGLADYIESLAQTIPSAAKRDALLQLHQQSLMAQMQYSNNSAEEEESASQKKAGKKKKKKRGKFERMRLGDMDEALALRNNNSSQSQRRVQPHNQWSHGTLNF